MVLRKERDGQMTYGDLMLMFLGEKPIPKDLDPRIRKLNMMDCLNHGPNDEIIFEEDTEMEEIQCQR